MTTAGLKKTRTEEDFLTANMESLGHQQKPVLTGATQAQLFNLGMRVRKSIADGYRTKKPSPTPTLTSVLSQQPQLQTEAQPETPQSNPLKRRIDDYFPRATGQGQGGGDVVMR
ncbi:hypothetical protein HK097_002092 [Rhizophlyctis rosea]|uniref:Uncharacterized protein n=1 Tax=Rhizophlyctis rosea TaxID=64517 RepID=A0AAD5S3W2_9FUNG|nr:hypothetical protein HK097_002092 [Rhizophlyctis rosea]